MTNNSSPSGNGAPPPRPGEDTRADGAPRPSGAVYSGIPEPQGFYGRNSALVVYPATIALTLAAVGLRMSFDVFGTGIPPFVLFYPVVLVCTLFGGIGAGILSLAIAGSASIYFWVDPLHEPTMSATGAISFALFVISNAINIFVAHRLRGALGALRQSEARLALSQTVGRIGIWDLNLRTGDLWWSPTFRELTGIGPEQEPSIEAFMARIVEADRERATQCFEDARRGLDRLDIDFRFTRGDGSIMWLAGRAELFRDAQGKPTRLLGINFDATPIRTAENERDRANSLLQTFFDSLPGAAFAKDLEGRYLIGNPIFAAAMGHGVDSFTGRTDLELMADEEQARTIMANDQAVLAGGVPRQVEEALLLPNGELSYWLAVKAPFFDADGQMQGIMGISLDVTDRRKAEERLRFLADEVDHRAKNLLGVVLSLVRLTKVDDVVAFKAAVSGRIEALARAHTLLAANRWQGVNIATLLREEIAPFGRVGTERVHLVGPPLMLEPNAAQALAMAIHELAINAAMHGALSVDGGRLAVAWEVSEASEGSRLVLSWQETGGPAVAPPVRAGFGSTAIRGAIEHQLGGTFDLDWAPTGLNCRITFPFTGNAPGDRPTLAADSDEPAPAAAAGPVATLDGKRVLILEDEALIALTLMDAVRELGCTIVGPASTIGAALDLVRQSPPDIAILDVNLAGTGSAPVAAALRERGVQFVYCTGYAEPGQQIATELAAPMLTKPIDPRALAEALRAAAYPQGAVSVAGPGPIGA